MKFSVILLTYNSTWEDIKTSIDSIIEQNLDDYELVVSDDGSKENHYDKIEKYLKEKNFDRYVLVPREKNTGTVKNILDALNASSGKYIRDFGAGDSFYNENSLKMIYDFMEEKKCEMCFGLMQGFYMDGDRKVLTNFYHPFDLKAYVKHDYKRIKQNMIVFRDYASGACTCYKKDIYMKYLRMLEDKVIYTEDIFQILAGLDDIYMEFLPEYVVWYETQSGISNSGGFSPRLHKDVESFYSYLYENYGDEKYVKKQKRVGRLYKIKNLYLRTILRMFVNPGTIVYLFRHFCQMKTNIYKPKNK